MRTTTLLLSCGLLAVGSAVSGTGVAGASVIQGQMANWAGYADTLPSNSGYRIVSASGYFTVPAVQSPAGSSSAYSSFWIGLDGFSTPALSDTALAQIGINADVINGLGAVYIPFWQMIRAGGTSTETAITTVPIFPGDVIGVGVIYSPSAQNFSMMLDNVTTGVSFTTAQTGDGQGLTVEWVAEDTTVRGMLPTLANFGTVAFSGAALGVENSSGSVFNGPIDSISSIGGNTYALAMVQGNNVLALSSVLSDSGTGSSEASNFNVVYQPIPDPPAVDLLALGAMAIPLIRRHRAMRR